MSREEPRYALYAFYMGGLDTDKDAAIEKAAKRESDGSGMDLSDGERDMSFSFFRKSTAEAAAKRVKAIKGVRVELRDIKDDKDIPI